MTEETLIFLNKDAMKVEEIFLDSEWFLDKLFDNIYSISISQTHKLNWLVKVYDKTKYAKRESENLNRLKKISTVPKTLAVGLSRNFSYVILSKAPGIDLFEYTKKHGNFSEQEVIPIAKQILTTIDLIHSNKIIHLDIKPENIIYDKETGTTTVIDFEGKSTEDYRSPEQINKKNITYKTDIWSIGVTIYYLTHGKVPFRTKNAALEKDPIFSKKFSEDFTDFLSCLLEKNIYLRYNAKDALNHPWISA
jgi:serine/threonine protein kinase